MPQHTAAVPRFQSNGWLESSLDNSEHAAMLCDENARVLMLNSAAEECLQSDDGISLRRGCLAVSDCIGRQRFQTLLKEACRHRLDEAIADWDGAMRIPRPSGQLPYQLVVRLLPAAAGMFSSNSSAVRLTISDPSRISSAKMRAIGKLYDLTAAEVRLAHHLMLAQTLEEIAKNLGVAITTIRTQLQSLMRKTDTRRQAQLVRLFSTVPE